MMKTITESGEKVIELLRPEAEALVKLALSERSKMTTKDGYAVVMDMLTHLMNSPRDVPPNQRKKISQLFLIACERAGYPEDTADTLRQIMGWH